MDQYERDLYEESGIVGAVKAQRLRLLGHVMRMRSDRGSKMAFDRKPEGARKRWCEYVKRI